VQKVETLRRRKRYKRPPIFRPSPGLRQASRLSTADYFFFFPPGITLATALAIDPATFATTPFLEARFFELDLLAVDFFDFEALPRAFAAGFDLDFELVFFFAAVFAITDSYTSCAFG